MDLSRPCPPEPNILHGSLIMNFGHQKHDKACVGGHVVGCYPMSHGTEMLLDRLIIYFMLIVGTLFTSWYSVRLGFNLFLRVSLGNFVFELALWDEPNVRYRPDALAPSIFRAS